MALSSLAGNTQQQPAGKLPNFKLGWGVRADLADAKNAEGDASN